MEQESILQNMAAENCNSMYFNSFSIAVGTGDVVMTLRLNGKPILVLNTSYTVAKTLGIGLGTVISELENKSATTIMTIETVANALINDFSDESS